MDFIYTVKYIFEKKNKIAFFDFVLFYFSISLFSKFKMKSNGALSSDPTHLYSRKFNLIPVLKLKRFILYELISMIKEN